jgi:Family of unknown function (DUF6364)
MAKLTLSIEPDKIEKAKIYAHKHHTSISKIVSDFLADITKKDEVDEEDPFIKKLRQIEISDEIKALAGILKGKVPDDINLWDAKYEYLKEKYDL